ncbi:hypothetical protein KJ656_14500, partial [bacterium]|nr:hypothetical protein [bacterium]
MKHPIVADRIDEHELKRQLKGVKICRISTVPFFMISQLKWQVEYLRDMGMKVVLVSSEGPEWSMINTGQGLSVKIINIPRSLKPWKDFIALIRLTQFFLIHRFDIAHSTTPKAGLLTALAAFISGIPIRLHTFTGQQWVTLKGLMRWSSRMDADDTSLPDRFQKQMAWLQQTMADICGGWVKLTGTWFHRVWRYYGSSDAIRLKLLFGSAFAHPTVMLRSSVAKANPYNEKAHYVEDYELWTRLAKLGVKMTNYPGVILRYRIHPCQVTAIRQKQQRENMVQIFQEYATSFLDGNLTNDPIYLLIADKQLGVNEADFYQAVAFMNRMVLRHGDPEGVV